MKTILFFAGITPWGCIAELAGSQAALWMVIGQASCLVGWLVVSAVQS